MTGSVNQQQRSKKVSDFRSLRHEEHKKKSAQSSSSLSSYIWELRTDLKRLQKLHQLALQSIKSFRQLRETFIGYTDEFSRQQVEYAEGELQIWQAHLLQTQVKLKSVNNKLIKVSGSRKTKNYAIKKVEEPPSPPSDNE